MSALRVASRPALIALVLLVSAWMQWTTWKDTIVYAPVRADAAAYVAYAWNLKQSHVFSREPTWSQPARTTPPTPDKMTLPGYPTFLSWFMGDKVDWRFMRRVTAAQALLGVLACALVLAAAMRLLPFGWAIATGLLVALHPHFATISTYLTTESLFTFLVAASMYALVRAVSSPASTGWHVATGALFALASYVRPQLAPLPWLLAILCLLPAWRSRLPKALAGLACFVALAMPWQLRNASTPQGNAPDLLAATLYHGAFPDMKYRDDPKSFGIAYHFDPQAGVHGASASAAVRHIAREFQAAPVRMARWYLVGKPWFFLSWSIAAGGGGDVFVYSVYQSPFQSSPPHLLVRVLSRTVHGPLMLAFLATLVVLGWRPRWFAPISSDVRALRVLAVVSVALLVLHAIGAPYPRYAVPFRPWFFLLAMAGMAALVQHAKHRSQGR